MTIKRFMTAGRATVAAAAVALVWVFSPPVQTLTAEVSPPNSCPRPTDQYGPRYQIMTGAYQSRGETTGGGKFVTIMMDDSAAPISVSVTGEVFDVAGNILAGTRITLVGYVSNSMSGARPVYSCIELAQ